MTKKRKKHRLEREPNIWGHEIFTCKNCKATAGMKYFKVNNCGAKKP